jgi:hypothetical protein
LVNRSVAAGDLSSFAAGRVGRSTRSPPQLGHRPPNLVSAHAAQKVHSNEQIRAFGAPFGKSQSQHSQLGRIASIVDPRCRAYPAIGAC